MTAEVEHRALGDSGLRVSSIAYGNWLTHDQPDTGTAQDCVAAALAAGITTFDTADVYGEPHIGAAEEALGRALAGVPRSSVVIMTKVYMRVGPGANDQGLSRKHLLESCHASLRRLRTDYLDVYQAHRYDPDTPLAETMVAFADLVRQGKVRYVGVSEWTAAQIRAGAALARQLGVPLVSNQPQYSMLWRVVEAEVVPACAEAGLGLLAFSPLAQGVLTGKYLATQPAPAGTRAASGPGVRFVDRYRSAPVLAAVRRLEPLAAELGLSLAQLAVAWVLNRPAVAAAVVGASRPAQLVETAAAAGVRLDADVLARIDAALVDRVHGDLVERDPAKTARLSEVMPSWRAEQPA